MEYMDLYQMLWFFLVYSVIGWCIEVVYHAISMGRVINRGFLNGPVCPVYGFGMLCVLTLADIVRPADGAALSAPVLFLGGMVLASLVELIAGWLLDVLFHARWWDYSGVPFNFHGYICLKFSILWGIGNVYVMKLVHPVLAVVFTGMLPRRTGMVLLAILYAIYAADTVVTVLIVSGMNKKLEILDDLRLSMRIVSDRMSEKLGNEAIETVQRIDENRVRAALAKAELKELVEETKNESLDKLQRRKALLEEKAESLKKRMMKPQIFGIKRLFRAFPGMKSSGYAEVIALLKELL